MLHTFSIGREYLGSGWVVHPLSGSLLKTSAENVSRFQSPRLPPIVHNGLVQCDEPYLLKPPRNILSDPNLDWSEDGINTLQIHKYFKRMKQYRAFNFFASVVYASLPKPCFRDSRAAMKALNALDQSETHDTCLEKCLTAAKCSTSFRNKGVVYIGAHLPLQAMHAWIIEDGCQPDDNDRQWVNFVPLMAIAHSNVSD